MKGRMKGGYWRNGSWGEMEISLKGRTESQWGV